METVNTPCLSSSQVKPHHDQLLKKHKPKKVKEETDAAVSATVCANCGTHTTPLWRRAPNGDTICNACGLYLKARNNMRPPTLKRNNTRKPEGGGGDCGSGPTSGSCPGGGHCNGTGGSASCAGCPAFNQHQVNRQALICANCRATTTPLWRRDEAGNTICNACGLYYKLHNVHRPVSMKRSVIKRRKRVIMADGPTEEGETDDDGEMSTPALVNDTGSSSGSPPAEVEKTPVIRKRRSAVATAEKRGKRPKIPVQQDVPAIEDYIVPKRTAPPEPPLDRPASQSMQHRPLVEPQAIISNSNKPIITSTTTIVTTPSPAATILPLPQIYTASQSPRYQPIDDKMFFRSPEEIHTSMALPPISSERQSAHRLESMFGRRRSSSSSSTYSLPPIALPPLAVASRAPSASPVLTQQRTELAEFDHVLERLDRVRKQAKPEQAYALSQLTQMLSDITSKAETIVWH
ncbi:putative electron transfer flavoprotein subunit [Apophysomyces sp. BC1034]|nr:putative electron transfer flavoprotein subunit [Apophysomyces sp. BC1015]KAG0170671.1 putative electron transfer flavoprotein subunit [Apophysomyces sp. BC1021]KAG0184708.1 putative electron transfer flavoprotein subunit [Apophysomyces sp. BC1034]